MTDYAALAAQYGGQSVDGSVDYTALAKKYGAQPVSAMPEAATRPEFNTPFGSIKTDPNESGLNIPALLLSAGQKMDSLNQGIRRAKLEATGTVYTALGMDKQAQMNAEAQAAQAAEEDQKSKAFAQLQAVHPGSTELGGVAPLLPLGPSALTAAAALEYGTPTERATRAGASMLGNKLAMAGGKIAQRQLASSTEQAAANIEKNAATQPFRDAGLTVPPAQANPTLMNQVLEGMAGGTKTDQGASVRNAPVFARLAKDGLPGFPKDTNLSLSTVRQYRTEAGKPYEAIKAEGPFVMDSQFHGEIAAARPSISSEVPELANAAIDNTIKALSKPEFSGNTAIELVKKLRYEAGVNFKNRMDPDKLALAQFQKDAADAMEEAIGRNLAAKGQTQKLSDFQAAREKIAKSWTVENALDSAGVSAKDFAKQAGKKPLTGPHKTIADFYEQYPKSSQVVDSATKANPFSVVDTFMSGLAASGTGNPLLMGGVFARPVLRAGLLSGPYQRAMTRLPEKPKGRAAADLLNSPYAPYIGGLLGYQAASR